MEPNVPPLTLQEGRKDDTDGVVRLYIALELHRSFSINSFRKERKLALDLSDVTFWYWILSCFSPFVNGKITKF